MRQFRAWSLLSCLYSCLSCLCLCHHRSNDNRITITQGEQLHTLLDQLESDARWGRQDLLTIVWITDGSSSIIIIIIIITIIIIIVIIIVIVITSFTILTTRETRTTPT
jgi:hypothetical protein